MLSEIKDFLNNLDYWWRFIAQIWRQDSFSNGDFGWLNINYYYTVCSAIALYCLDCL